MKAFSVYAQDKGITKEIVIAYKNNLQENYAVRSVNSMLASINSLFAFLNWFDLRVKSLKLQQQVFCSEEKELTRAEYKRLCQAAKQKKNERLNLIIQTICATGIRVSELQYITVEAAKCGEAIVNCKAKTRTAFIVKELKQKLLRYAAEQGIKSGMIFVTKSGKAYLVVKLKDLQVADGQRVAYLCNFEVKRMWQNKGVGTKILHTVMEYAKQNGFEKLTLSVYEDNRRNMHLYGKVGFRAKIKTLDTDLLFFTPSGDPIKTETQSVYSCAL